MGTTIIGYKLVAQYNGDVCRYGYDRQTGYSDWSKFGSGELFKEFGDVLKVYFKYADYNGNSIGDQCISDIRICAVTEKDVDRSSYKNSYEELIRKEALAKLTDEERRVLGL